MAVNSFLRALMIGLYAVLFINTVRLVYAVATLSGFRSLLYWNSTGFQLVVATVLVISAMIFLSIILKLRSSK